MIYDTHGKPIADVLREAAIAVAEQRARQMQSRGRYAYLTREGENGPQRLFRVQRDKLGDILRVHRAVETHTSGRRHTLVMAIKAAGSQRKAAKAMGVALSTLQRRLANAG